jgi:hypothetical protein
MMVMGDQAQEIHQQSMDRNISKIIEREKSRELLLHVAEKWKAASSLIFAVLVFCVYSSQLAPPPLLIYRSFGLLAQRYSVN